MAGNAGTESRVRSGLFEVDLVSGELFKSGRKIGLQEQPFRVLSLLLERPGELVTRRELQDRLWSADTNVGFDEGLNTAIRKLRAAFDDSADNPRFIQTVPRRGYRFIAPVSRSKVESSAEPATPVMQTVAALAQPLTPASQARTRIPRWSTGLLCILLLLLLGAIPGVRRFVFGLIPAAPHPSPAIRSLAVLPLENLSNDPAQDYFTDGMTDELITDLGQIKALRVISRTSIMQYKKVRKPLAEIARELNVDAVVEGTVLRSGSEVRITAQLIQAPQDKHLWAKSYRGDMRDAIDLQNRVANAIAEEIRVALTPEERASLSAGHPVSPEAFEDYLQGRYFWNKRGVGDMERAIDYFQRATAIDPNYAPAYAGLAQSYVLLGGNIGQQDGYIAAGKKAAAQALSLDPNLSEAHTALALLLEHDYNFKEEEKEFVRAVTLDPNYATGHHWYGEVFLAQFGRFDEANREMQRALALDPASHIIATDWGVTLYWERRYSEAYNQLTKVVALDPEFSEAFLWRGRVLVQEKRYPEALADLEAANRLNPSDRTIGPTLAFAYGMSANRAKATALLQRMLAQSRERYVSPWAFSYIYLGLGNRSKSLDWMEKAIREHCIDMLSIEVAPDCDSLRSEPRFKALVASIRGEAL